MPAAIFFFVVVTRVMILCFLCICFRFALSAKLFDCDGKHSCPSSLAHVIFFFEKALFDKRCFLRSAKICCLEEKVFSRSRCLTRVVSFQQNYMLFTESKLQADSIKQWCSVVQAEACQLFE